MAVESRQARLQVGEELGQAFQVAALAVAQGQPAEDAQYLEGALGGHGLGLGEEGVGVHAGGEAAIGDGAAAKGLHPDGKACRVEAAVAAPQQRDQVVAQRSGHGVLEVDQGKGVALDHQVHGVIVAMHGDHRLGQGRGDQRLAQGAPARRRVEGEPLAQAPLREEVQLTTQQLGVEAGQRIRPRTVLQGVDQRHGALVPGADLGVADKAALQGGVAQVLELQEAPRQVVGVELRYRQAGGGPAPGDGHEGAAVLLLRGGIHQHAGGAARQVKAVVAAKAGVAGGQTQVDLRRGQGVALGDPVPELVEARRGGVGHGGAGSWSKWGGVVDAVAGGGLYNTDSPCQGHRGTWASDSHGRPWPAWRPWAWAARPWRRPHRFLFRMSRWTFAPGATSGPPARSVAASDLKWGGVVDAVAGGGLYNTDSPCQGHRGTWASDSHGRPWPAWRPWAWAARPWRRPHRFLFRMSRWTFAPGATSGPPARSVAASDR